MEWLTCEFFVVRYVPDTVRGEFINIGIALRGPRTKSDSGVSGPESRSVIRFTRDWSRVLCLDPQADTGLLEDLAAEFAVQLSAHADAKDLTTLIDLFADTLSNNLQLSDPRAVLVESTSSQIDTLMSMYVNSHELPPPAIGRPILRETMKLEFQHTGVWSRMRHSIPISDYTGPGDSQTIDCGYQAVLSPDSGRVLKLFHAVSIITDGNHAKCLAFSATALRECVSRIEGATLELTAVVEPVSQCESSDQRDLYSFCMMIFEEAGIQVLPLDQLPEVAQIAAHELGEGGSAPAAPVIEAAIP